jgi:hypothetical protein
MQTVDLTRKRELQKLANARGYSLRTRRPTKSTRGYWLSRARAGSPDDFLYEVREGETGVLCRNLTMSRRLSERSGASINGCMNSLRALKQPNPRRSKAAAGAVVNPPRRRPSWRENHGYGTAVDRPVADMGRTVEQTSRRIRHRRRARTAGAPVQPAAGALAKGNRD